MGFVRNLTILISILIAMTLYSTMKSMFKYPETPQVENIWWGAGEPSKTDTSIRPFKINVADNVSIWGNANVWLKVLKFKKKYPVAFHSK